MGQVVARIVLALALCSAPIVTTGCAGGPPATAQVPPGPDATLAKVATGIKDANIAVGGLEKTIIALNGQKQITDATATKILGICQKVNVALADASKVTRNLAALAPADRSNVANILTPIIAVVSAEVTSNDIVTIANVNTRNAIQSALVAINTGLEVLKAVL